MIPSTGSPIKFKQRHVSTVVRCCQPTYSSEALLQHNIDLVELPYRDGSVPNSGIIEQWLQLLNLYDHQYQLSGIKPTICCHCLSGLGRAPVLVAIALIEYGIAALDAIGFIREKRRGAFNKQQILFLDQYKPTSKNNHHLHYRSIIHMFSLSRMMKKWTNKPLSQQQQKNQHEQNQYQLINMIT
ncbi:unnamed protein product [Cunninghamella echinulata]